MTERNPIFSFTEHLTKTDVSGILVDMIDTQRLVTIIEEAKKRKTATWPQCCPWSLASSPEIEQMAQELLEVRSNAPVLASNEEYFRLIEESKNKDFPASGIYQLEIE